MQNNEELMTKTTTRFLLNAARSYASGVNISRISTLRFLADSEQYLQTSTDHATIKKLKQKNIENQNLFTTILQQCLNKNKYVIDEDMVFNVLKCCWVTPLKIILQLWDICNNPQIISNRVCEQVIKSMNNDILLLFIENNIFNNYVVNNNNYILNIAMDEIDQQILVNQKQQYHYLCEDEYFLYIPENQYLTNTKRIEGNKLSSFCLTLLMNYNNTNFITHSNANRFLCHIIEDYDYYEGIKNFEQESSILIKKIINNNIILQHACDNDLNLLSENLSNFEPSLILSILEATNIITQLDSNNEKHFHFVIDCIQHTEIIKRIITTKADFTYKEDFLLVKKSASKNAENTFNYLLSIPSIYKERSKWIHGATFKATNYPRWFINNFTKTMNITGEEPFLIKNNNEILLTAISNANHIVIEKLLGYKSIQKSILADHDSKILITAIQHLNNAIYKNYNNAKEISYSIFLLFTHDCFLKHASSNIQNLSKETLREYNQYCDTKTNINTEETDSTNTNINIERIPQDLINILKIIDQQNILNLDKDEDFNLALNINNIIIAKIFVKHYPEMISKRDFEWIRVNAYNTNSTLFSYLISLNESKKHQQRWILSTLISAAYSSLNRFIYVTKELEIYPDSIFLACNNNLLLKLFVEYNNKEAVQFMLEMQPIQQEIVRDTKSTVLFDAINYIDINIRELYTVCQITTLLLRNIYIKTSAFLNFNELQMTLSSKTTRIVEYFKHHAHDPLIGSIFNELETANKLLSQINTLNNTNTHLYSVHSSVSESAIKLLNLFKTKFSHIDDIDNYFASEECYNVVYSMKNLALNNLTNIKSIITEIRDFQPEIDEEQYSIILHNSVEYIMSIDNNANWIDTRSQMSIRILLSTLCHLIKGLTDKSLQTDANIRLFAHLFLTQTEYNLFSHDSPSCKSGIFNDLVYSQQSIFPEVNILVHTKEISSNILRQKIMQHLANIFHNINNKNIDTFTQAVNNEEKYHYINIVREVVLETYMAFNFESEDIARKSLNEEQCLTNISINTFGVNPEQLLDLIDLEEIFYFLLTPPSTPTPHTKKCKYM